MLYQYHSDNDTLTGYVNFSLSVFNVSDMPPEMGPDPDLFNTNYSICR